MTSWLALDFIPIERDIRGEATKEPINAGFRQHQARAKREVSFLNPFLCRCGLAGKLGRRRALFEHRSSLRSVQAVQGELHSRPICLSIRRNPAGAAQQGGVSWVTFFSRIKKVTCRRAAPANIHVYRTYDALNRMTGESGPAKTQTITYDENGNRLSDGAGSYVYETTSNRMSTRLGLAVTFDAAGNMTADGTGRTFAYNQANQLNQVLQGGILIASYYYDANGLRSRKVTTASAPQGAQTILYEYDEEGHLIGELSGTGTPLRTYAWREDTPVAQIDYQPSRRVLHFDPDHLNTPRAAMDETGKVVWRWESDAFGSTAPNEDADGDGNLTTINSRFSGYYADIESGLFYAKHRYYSPLLGIFTQTDRLDLLRQAVNPLYAGYSEPTDLQRALNQPFNYAGNNPMSEIDPLGLMGSGVGSLNKKKQPQTPRYPGSSCGPAGDPNNFPNQFGGASIDGACQNHDRCYEDCSKTKSQCDAQLYFDIRRACDSASNPAACYSASLAYYGAVRVGGNDPFKKARQEKCQCSSK